MLNRKRAGTTGWEFTRRDLDLKDRRYDTSLIN
jgi:hypothetical protein